MAGVLVLEVSTSSVGAELAKALIRSELSLTDVADWTDSKSSVPTSDVPAGKSGILMFAMAYPQKIVIDALVGSVTWMSVLNLIPVPAIKLENGLLVLAGMLNLSRTVPLAPPSRKMISPAAPPDKAW